MSDNQKHEQRRFAIEGIKNTGFYYTKSLVDGKYKLPILYCLQLDGPTRYNELQRKMETATFRSLSKALKELEADGLIIRKDYGEIPPRVEYSLSERGKSLEPGNRPVEARPQKDKRHPIPNRVPHFVMQSFPE